MQNRIKIFNLISIISLSLLTVLYVLGIMDSPLSWRLLPGDTLLFFPFLFLIPLILSITSLKKEKTTVAKISLGIAIFLLITTGLLSLYIFILGSAWTN